MEKRPVVGLKTRALRHCVDYLKDSLLATVCGSTLSTDVEIVRQKCPIPFCPVWKKSTQYL